MVQGWDRASLPPPAAHDLRDRDVAFPAGLFLQPRLLWADGVCRQTDRCGATGEQKSGEPQALRQEKGHWRPEQVAGPQSRQEAVDPRAEAACDAPSPTSRVVTRGALGSRRAGSGARTSEPELAAFL